MTRLLTPQDFRTRLRPGSFVYPYFTGQFMGKVGQAWGCSDRLVEKHMLLPYKKELMVCTDHAISSVLRQSEHTTKQYKFAKVRYLEKFDFIRIMTEDKDSTTIQKLKFPLPLGIYLGECIQLQHNGQNLQQDFYTKILTLDGTLFWV